MVVEDMTIYPVFASLSVCDCARGYAVGLPTLAVDFTKTAYHFLVHCLRLCIVLYYITHLCDIIRKTHICPKPTSID